MMHLIVCRLVKIMINIRFINNLIPTYLKIIQMVLFLKSKIILRLLKNLNSLGSKLKLIYWEFLKAQKKHPLEQKGGIK